MYDLSIGDKSYSKRISKKFSIDKERMNSILRFDGPYREMIDNYYWIFNFAYYLGKGYTTLKLEDNHYFSESSQFGANIRQIKGGSIQAFQQNLNQLIQLVKMHMFPLLKEVKQADFYYRWIKKIKDNDELLYKELEKKNPNEEELRKLRFERDEAISHLKDKWVTEVDGSKLWALNKPASEQGLDYTLLPELFFGTSLDDPLQRKSTLKEQLDNTVYKVEISENAKEQVARFLYRFYTWLPSAIRDTEVTFKMKVSSLKQFYSQFEMYMEFLRPILIEISKKKEGFDKNSLYYNNETENHLLANMIDNSYSFIRNLGIRGFGIRGDKHKINDLNFTRFGWYVNSENGDIWSGVAQGKNGYIYSEKDGKYFFIETNKRNITTEKFKELKKNNTIKIDKKDLKVWPCIEFEFLQKRRNVIKSSPQGQMQVPFIQNTITFKAYSWNTLEIAAYREKLKANDFEVLETFIEEISHMKDDLMKYVNMLEDEDIEDEDIEDEDIEDKKKQDKKKDNNKEDSIFKDLVLGPFDGFYSIFKHIIPDFKFSKFESKGGDNKSHPKDDEILIAQLSALEDVWKVYWVHKKVHKFIQY